MRGLPASLTPRTVAVAGGVAHLVAVFAWAWTSGVSVGPSDPLVIAVSVGYAGLGVFLLAALPLYLLARLSLVTPIVIALWIAGETVVQWLLGTHLHPISSYLTVSPLLVGVVLAVGIAEALSRYGAERVSGRLGLGRLV